MSRAEFTIRGVRGGMAVSGGEFLKYGGNTTCFSLRTDEGLLLLDAGTGIASVGRDTEPLEPSLPVTVLFTHFHLDHVVGLPFLQSLNRKNASVCFMADPRREDPWRQSLARIYGKPYWPVELRETAASVSFRDLPAETGSAMIHGVRVAWCPVWHPQQCLAYRLETASATIVIATDHECGNKVLDPMFLDFCRGADVLIYDAQYTPEEYAHHRGLGHGTWRDGVDIAKEAGVGDLILTHLDRNRTDAAWDGILATAQGFFPTLRSAYEGMAIAM